MNKDMVSRIASSFFCLSDSFSPFFLSSLLSFFHIGIDRNISEALLWYHKSAKDGHMPSKIKICLLINEINSGNVQLPEGQRGGMTAEENALISKVTNGGADSSQNSEQFEELVKSLSFVASKNGLDSPICPGSPSVRSNTSFSSGKRTHSESSLLGIDEQLDPAVIAPFNIQGMSSSKALFELGICYEEGNGVEPDYALALQWYTQSALSPTDRNDSTTTSSNGENQAAESQFRLGLYHEFGTNGAEKDIYTSLSWYRQAASNGHSIAQYKIGICYEKGFANIEKNEQLAIHYYRQSSEQGYAPAQHQLGLCLFNGIGMMNGGKNVKEAVRWYQLSAEQGYPPAINSLGFCYFHGFSVNKNVKLAIKLYKLAADNGYVIALNNLGYCYMNGLGVIKNEVMAFRLYKIAAKQGYAPSQNNVGNCYFNGTGITKNIALAFGWYKLSAAQEYTTAQYNLGYCYEKGYNEKGGNQIAGSGQVKLAEALKLYHKAALKGNRKAMIAIRKFPKVTPKDIANLD
jgi:TPR repeat protein